MHLLDAQKGGHCPVNGKTVRSARIIIKGISAPPEKWVYQLPNSFTELRRTCVLPVCGVGTTQRHSPEGVYEKPQPFVNTCHRRVSHAERLLLGNPWEGGIPIIRWICWILQGYAAFYMCHLWNVISSSNEARDCFRHVKLLPVAAMRMKYPGHILARSEVSKNKRLKSGFRAKEGFSFPFSGVGFLFLEKEGNLSTSESAYVCAYVCALGAFWKLNRKLNSTATKILPPPCDVNGEMCGLKPSMNGLDNCLKESCGKCTIGTMNTKYRFFLLLLKISLNFLPWKYFELYTFN